MGAPPKLEELRAVVRARGLRATPSRMAVLHLLQGSAQPLSHADVIDKLSSEAWDPATLYRNLVDLAEVGLLRRQDMGDHVWRFDVVDSAHDAQQHPHFVCTECGTVECLPTVDIIVPRTKTPRAVKQRKVEVQVRGVCDGCV